MWQEGVAASLIELLTPVTGVAQDGDNVQRDARIAALEGQVKDLTQVVLLLVSPPPTRQRYRHAQDSIPLESRLTQLCSVCVSQLKQQEESVATRLAGLHAEKDMLKVVAGLVSKLQV